MPIKSEAMKPEYRLASSGRGFAETGRYINWAVKYCSVRDMSERLAARGVSRVSVKWDACFG